MSHTRLMGPAYLLQFTPVSTSPMCVTYVSATGRFLDLENDRDELRLSGRIHRRSILEGLC